jgi:hypothetical protein
MHLTFKKLAAFVCLSLLIVVALAQSSDGWRRSRRMRPPVLPSYDMDNFETPESGPPKNEYTFARLVYSGGTGWRYDSWTTDAPKADVTFVAGIKRLTNLDVRDSAFYVPLTSTEIFKYPFLYAVEVGYMRLSPEEVEVLREYLLRGGFLVVDDFHGSYEWANFEGQMREVFPNGTIEDLPLSHPIFHCFFDIEELIQVPGIQYLYTGRKHERDGYEAQFKGVFDESGKLRVMVNFNSDLGDAWEWADFPPYPEQYSSTAYRLGINYIIYSMTH